MEILSKKHISNTTDLPEKVLQFGTGVLLRGLPDYIIDQANKAGIFNGRIVVVKSTDQGGTDAFTTQEGLYTVCVRGIQDGETIEKNVINTAISRVLAASSQWDAILGFAASKDLEVIISNTTEVGITLVKEKISEGVPSSFPAKLLAVLYKRYQTLGADSGLVIIPTELISDNGHKLRDIVLELAQYNELETDFIDWLQNANSFCNSLVDRIVPGKPKGEAAEIINASMDYQDDLAIVAEPYALWAIQGDETVAKKLSFIQVNEGAFVENNIEKYKELKLRLLNGTHTLTCALAYQAGFITVKEAMNNTDFYAFIKKLMYSEVGPSIPYELDKQESQNFANSVLDRFSNPFLEHFWLSISLNYTQKIEMRVVSLLREYFKNNSTAPQLTAAGIAAYIEFMRTATEKDGKYYGNFNDSEYLIQDPEAGVLSKLAKENTTSEALVDAILGGVFGVDLRNITNLKESIVKYLNEIQTKGALGVIQELGK